MEKFINTDIQTAYEKYIQTIDSMDYPDEWKEEQKAGALLTFQTRDSMAGKEGYKPPVSSTGDGYWPNHKPDDLPKEPREWDE